MTSPDLRTIDELAENKGCAGLADKFASEMEANDYFVDKVIHLSCDGNSTS